MDEETIKSYFITNNNEEATWFYLVLKKLQNKYYNRISIP